MCVHERICARPLLRLYKQSRDPRSLAFADHLLKIGVCRGGPWMYGIDILSNVRFGKQDYGVCGVQSIGKVPETIILVFAIESADEGSTRK